MSVTQTMRCPSCGSEYRTGFETCADCGVALEHADATSPAVEPVDTLDWSPLRTLSSESEAVLLQGYLENAGVACAIESLVFHAEPFTFGPLAKVRVYVPTADHERAEQLLRACHLVAAPEPD